jgi:ornithine carbamoyltransferase
MAILDHPANVQIFDKDEIMAKVNKIRPEDQASTLYPISGEKAMSVKHLLSITDLGPASLALLVDRSVEFAAGRCNGHKPLTGKIVGMYFRGPSTRTRTSFTVGALKLGAQIVVYGPNDLQLVTGETIEDTARILSGFLDALVIRTNGSISEMRALTSETGMAVINAMSENEHPTQAIADLATIKERFGQLEGLHVLYLGEGNNTATALALAVALTPRMKVTFITPEAYGMPESLLKKACQLARQRGSAIEYHHRMDKLPRNVDAVYTTRWQTMGVPHPDPNWRDKFWPYRVTPAVMAEVSNPNGTIFLHDLPAVRGEDVQEEVLDGPQSLAWRQAQHKMFSAMAVLEWCLNDANHNTSINRFRAQLSSGRPA